MDLRKKLLLIFLFCLSLESSCSSGKRNYSSPQDSMKDKRNDSSEMKNENGNEYEYSNEAELTEYRFCSNCGKRARRFPNSIADKINSLKERTPSPSYREHSHISRTKIVPKESEKIAFSQKYNPDSGAENDGFVPVAGPYGTRSRRLRQNSFKLTLDDMYKATPSTRKPSKRSHDKNRYTIRQSSRIKNSQNVQRRAQYRHPKIYDELAVKESISNENILGNGNFEIIKGGIFSDQDANEILGSRRISRGFGSYIMPTYRQSQNRFTSVQNIKFPSFHQGRIQNPVQPMFYPRAPF